MALFGNKNKKHSNTGGQKIDRELRIISDSTSFGFREAYRALRTNLNYVMESGKIGHVIMVTSSVPAEAKSNVAANICVSVALEKKKPLLVDCDLRKGTLHRYLGISRRQSGLVEYLSDVEPDWHKCIVHLEEYGIDFMPSGMIVDNSTELLASSKTGRLFNELAGAYDMVICDTPPVNAVADTSVLARYTDGAILVVSHNQVTKDNVRAAKAQLEASNANILGVVLSMFDATKTGTDNTKHYAYYNYNYSGGYGYSDTAEKDKKED
jgi:capsular exopolysaccharide synthesis family protein